MTLKIANSVWHHHTFSALPEFIQLNQTYFNAEVCPADFRYPATVDSINDWSSRHTNGRIPKILDQLQANDLMALLNALFQGRMDYEFDKSQTRDRLFTLQAGNPVTTKMMSPARSLFLRRRCAGRRSASGGLIHDLLVPGSL